MFTESLAHLGDLQEEPEKIFATVDSLELGIHSRLVKTRLAYGAVHGGGAILPPRAAMKAFSASMLACSLGAT